MVRWITYNDIQLHEHEYLFVHFTTHGHGKEKLFKGLQIQPELCTYCATLKELKFSSHAESSHRY